MREVGTGRRDALRCACVVITVQEIVEWNQCWLVASGFRTIFGCANSESKRVLVAGERLSDAPGSTGDF